MGKPTADLVFKLMNFVENEPAVQRELDARDNDPATRFRALEFKWYGAPNDHRKVVSCDIFFYFDAPARAQNVNDIMVSVDIFPDHFRLIPPVKTF